MGFTLKVKRDPYSPYNQSHYREVPRWEISMEQELTKKNIWANYEQLLRPVFSSFRGQRKKK